MTILLNYLRSESEDANHAIQRAMKRRSNHIDPPMIQHD